MLKLEDLNKIDSLANAKSCIVCREIPELSRLYRCNMGGHIICNLCFSKLPKNKGARCSECNSVVLKIKETHLSLLNDTKCITVEQLFRLPTEQVNLLLNKSSQEMLKNNHIYITHNNNTTSDLLNAIKRNHQIPNSAIPSKPFKCPHLPCGKTVTSSSLKVHFNYEHPDIKTYLIKRNEELRITSNVTIIEYGVTHCIGMIDVYDEYKVVSRATDGLYKKCNQKMNVGTFWLLVSGSTQKQNSRSYVLYWLVTDSEFPFKCTLDISSSSNSSSYTTFCGVNDIRDDLYISNIAKKINCLFLSYGSLMNLKEQLGKVNLQIIVH